MEVWRCRLEHVSIRQSRKSKFVPPSQGESAGEAFRVVRVPVVYSLGRPAKKPSYGVWEGYIPGPRHPSPWGDNEGIGFSPDTLAPGGAHVAGPHRSFGQGASRDCGSRTRSVFTILMAPDPITPRSGHPGGQQNNA